MLFIFQRDGYTGTLPPPTSVAINPGLILGSPLAHPWLTLGSSLAYHWLILGSSLAHPWLMAADDLCQQARRQPAALPADV